MRRAISTHARMPPRERSLVYAKPSRRSSKTRMPMPRSPRAMTDSTAPSLISTDPDWASRRNTSPVAPVALSASSARSTVASLVRRSLIWQRPRAGGSCPGVGGARSPHPPHLSRRSLRSLREAGPRGTRGSRTPRSPVPPAGRYRYSLQLSAYDDAGNSNRWLGVGDRRSLTVLSTCARRIAEIISDHIDLTHQLRALAYQRGAPQRLGELAVVDAIALGDLEREVARHDVDLPAAHLLHEHSVLHRSKDLLGIRRAWRDHRVRHPADRQVTKGFAPRVTAALDAELLGVLSIGEIRTQHTLFDEDCPVCRRALVVHRRGAALVRIGAVVDHRDQLARDLLADPPGVDGEALQVQVSLEAMAHRLMDESPPGLAREHDRVRAGRRGLGADVEDRAPGRIPCRLVDRFVREHLEAGGAADRLESGLQDVSLLRDGLHGQVEADSRVRAEKVVAIGDEHLLHALAVARGDLVDPRVEASSDFVRAAEESNLSLDRDRPGVDRHGGMPRKLVRLGLVRFVELAAFGDASRRAPGEGHEVVDVGDVAVRVGRALAARYADARALIDSRDRVLDAAVVEDQLKCLVTLPEELSPIATSRKRGAERLSRFARADRRPTRDCCSDDRPPLP